MKKTAIVFILSCAMILLAGQSVSADPKSDLQAELDGLIKESNQMNQEKIRLDQEKSNLAVREQTLSRTAENLRQVMVQLKEAERLLVMEARQIERDKEALKAHPTCNGTYEPQEYARRKAWCDAEWAKIRERVRVFNLKVGNHESGKRVLIQARDNLSKAVVAWVADRKKLDGQYYDLAGKRRSWYLRVLNVKSSAFQQLKRMAGKAPACASLPGIGEFERRLDGASEQAHLCLQQLWDGARRR